MEQIAVTQHILTLSWPKSCDIVFNGNGQIVLDRFILLV